MTILIPAYEPDNRLVGLIDKLKETSNFNIIVVDDGSGLKYENIFKTVRLLGCTVLTHEVNRGKGCALKTGFKYLLENGEQEGVVCADSDGQHLPEDIIKVAKKVSEYKDRIILGCRHFVGNVPARSRFGNAVTRAFFRLATGNKIYDTQTGLRGFTGDMMNWLLQIPGERFEYEMNMLLDAKSAGYGFYEVSIDTVYLESNKSSHFRVIADSVRIYLPLIKFCASSMLSGLLDFVLLFIVQSLSSNLLLSTVTARIVSSLFNFFVNRKFVFSKNRESGLKKSIIKYYTLAAGLLALNYLLLSLLNEKIGIPLFYSKLVTETILFVLSYVCQQRFVFISDKAKTLTLEGDSYNPVKMKIESIAVSKDRKIDSRPYPLKFAVAKANNKEHQ